MQELDDNFSAEPPVWAIFGDLMSGLVGVFVLILIWVLGFQLELAQSLEQEKLKRQAAEERRLALEQALSDPLSSGRVTFKDGKIGISGSVLFAKNSDKLQREGRELLVSLVEPLQIYLGENHHMLMVSGFTDDLPIQKGNYQFADNWELSAKRALTVTRELIAAGMPADMVFAAAFGEHNPVVPNEDKASRAKNRRVEMTPVPKASQQSQAEKNAGIEAKESQESDVVASPESSNSAAESKL